ncbi:hypothetical protein TNCV_2338211 [Trichonephila clavipes]|nr:hypothetical protein TNCV_2338211 [Trichonephila clavipes]
MSRFGGMSEERPSVFLSSEASLVLIYRPNVAGMKGRFDLAQPVNRTPDLWCGSTIHYHSILFGNRDYTGMWVRLGSTDLMAGKVVFLCGLSSPIRMLDLTVMNPWRILFEVVRSALKKHVHAISRSFFPSYVCQKKPPV